MLCHCVWYFNFAYFIMTVVKNLMKKYPVMMYFQNLLHNIFVRETLDASLSKIQFLWSSLVFLSLNNPSLGQYISIREFYGSSILLN